ncbi:MAG: hypothetical protein ABJB05_11330 [Parafilimonas sp.]
MKKYFITTTILLTVLYSYSQNTSTVNTDKAAQFSFGIGGAYNNIKNLNTALSNASLPTIGKFNLAGIAEGNFRMKNLLFGLNSGMGAYAKKSDHYNTSVMSYSGGVNIGYYIINDKKFHLAPQAGIGFYSTQVKITQRNGFTNFNDVLASGNSTDIIQNTGVLDFCLKFDIADFTKDKTCLSGLRLGYKYGLSKRGWGIDETNNTTVDDSPKDRINEYYVLVTIGFSKLKPQKM